MFTLEHVWLYFKLEILKKKLHDAPKVKAWNMYKKFELSIQKILNYRKLISVNFTFNKATKQMELPPTNIFEPMFPN